MTDNVTYNVIRKRVPQYPAYLVCHDLYDKGAMEVWPMASLAAAQAKAGDYQRRLDEFGHDSCRYEAYAKLPRRRVWKLHEATRAVRVEIMARELEQMADAILQMEPEN